MVLESVTPLMGFLTLEVLLLAEDSSDLPWVAQESDDLLEFQALKDQAFWVLHKLVHLTLEVLQEVHAPLSMRTNAQLSMKNNAQQLMTGFAV